MAADPNYFFMTDKQFHEEFVNYVVRQFPALFTNRIITLRLNKPDIEVYINNQFYIRYSFVIQ
jgi:hypothetical protein